MKKMNWLGTLSISQLMDLIQRYDLHPHYKNPQKRVKAMKEAIRTYWKTHKEECAICLEPISFAHCSVTPCTHLFCDSCLIPHLSQKESCPLCRHPCSYIDILTQVSWKKMLKIILRRTNHTEREPERIMIQPEPVRTMESSTLALTIQLYVFVATGLMTMVSIINIIAMGLVCYTVLSFCTSLLNHYI